MLNGAQFVMKGFNYFPRDYGWTNMVGWDWNEVDHEFALGASLHANTLRTGMNYGAATGNMKWKKDIFRTYQILSGYLDAMDHLLSLADKHGLKVVMWLPDGIPWELVDPVHFSVYEKFLEGLIPRFANDTRIAAWDLATDIDAAWFLPSEQGSASDLFPWVTKDNMVLFLRHVAQTFRKLDPNHLLTVGFSWPSSSLLVQDFTDFLMPQFLGGDYPNMANGTVLGQPEAYMYGDNWDLTSIFLKGAAVERLEAKVKSIQKQLVKPMPLVLAEIGLSSCCESSLEIQRAVYDVVCELAFVRMKLAGALYWVLTDFTWPPKADPYWGENFVLSEWEKYWGVFTVNYAAKPAAEVIATYCEDHPTILLASPPSKLKFVFSNAVIPEGEDTMQSAKFDWIQFRDADGRVLYTLDIGTPEARQYLESQYQEDWKRGFWPDRGPWNSDYGDTEAQNLAYVGGPDKETTIFVPFPVGTRSITIRVAPVPEDMSMDVFVEGESVARLTLGSPYVWETYNVTLPLEAPLVAGDTLTMHGIFKMPISDGSATLQVSSDQQSWSNVTTSVPVRNGRFSGPIKFAEAGKYFARAVWSGGGDYLSSTSNTLAFEVAAKPVTVVTTSTTSVSSPAVASLTPDILTLAGVGIVVGIVIVAVAFLFMRRRTKSRSV